MQFKERRFLEAARKTIKNAELEAGSRLDADQGINYMQKTGADGDEEEKKEEWESKDPVGKSKKVCDTHIQFLLDLYCEQRSLDRAGKKTNNSGEYGC